MKVRFLFTIFLCLAANTQAQTLRVATFNVSMEATNYELEGEPSENTLSELLAKGTQPQINNIAEIIQRVNPDIILLNEFDYVPDPNKGVKRFLNKYLAKSQNGQPPVSFPYFYVSEVNTGLASPFDLDNNGKLTGVAGDAYGFGLYPGHYGMAVLSKYPIKTEQIRSFQQFLWKDMPNAQKPIDPSTSAAWYDDDEWANFRLSSKSHWDIPIDVDGELVHILAMHPTPPVFDGEEDRNGKRNHDEIRLFADYLLPESSTYIYDDKGQVGGLTGQERFVFVGDFNAADIGDKHRPNVIEQLTEHHLVDNVIPKSVGAAESASQDFSSRFTAYWGARADYVLPSKKGFNVVDAGVFWPSKNEETYRLIKDRKASSDHRLVWVDLVLTK